MRTLLVLATLWTAVFVVLALLLRSSARNDDLPAGSREPRRLPADVGPIPVQIMFAEVLPDHVRVDCILLADTSAHEAGYPLSLHIARPTHPALDGTMTATLTELADRLAQVELRFAMREGEPRVRIARDRTSMTFDLDAAA